MRILVKATKTAYIVPYSDSIEITKVVNGKTIRTGDYTQGYDNPFWVKAFVSSPKGMATVDINGVNVPEQRVMVINNDRDYITDNPLKEADIVLLPINPLSQSDDDVLELLLDEGKLSSFAKENFYAYRVSNIAVFDYHFRFTITRIEI